MTLRGLTLVLALAGGLGSLPAQAGQVRVVRNGDDRLRGITAVDVVIDPMPADAGRCGLTREALQTIVVGTLGTSGLKATVSEKASSWFHTVYATVSTVRSSGTCASSVVTELTAQVEGIPQADRDAPQGQWGSLLVGQLTLIRHNGIVSSRGAAHASHVRALLVEHLTDIAKRVAAANP